MPLQETRNDAIRSLNAANFSGKTLALIHTGAALALSLIITICNLVLAGYIDNTGGLAGIGTRSVLQAVQSVLSIGSSVCLPFWQIGFLFACIGYARNEAVAPSSLLEGFHRFGPILRLFLLETVIFVGVFMACFYASGTLIMFTPFFDTMAEAMEPIMNATVSPETLFSDPAVMDAMLEAATPMYVIAGILFFPIAIFLSYRLRMAQFAVMDDAPGAFAAIVGSFRMMRGNCRSLFKLDLSFWWFYGLKILAAVIACGDVLLSLCGVSLPVSPELLFFGFYGVYILLELVLNWQFSAYVQTTYAHCYEKLKANLPKPKMRIEG